MRTARRFALLLLVAGAACSGSRSDPVTVRSQQLEMQVAVEPPSLRVGENVLWLELRDAEGEPVTGAAPEVRVHMHAMGAMPAMGGPAAVRELGEGRYRADFELAMGSTWNVEVSARAPEGGMARAEGSLTVGTPGVRLEGVGGAGAGPEMDESAEKESGHPAEFRVAPARLQRVGVKTGVAERRAVGRTLRAVGRVVTEENTLEDVALKVRGWVGEVRVRAVGDPVERGQVLFSVYSPELYAAQEEYLQALRSQQRAGATSAPERADYLVRASRNRLQLWDIAAAELDRLARRGEPVKYLAIRAPVSGYVVEKNVVEGSAFEPGQRLYRIAPLGEVWIEAEIYESELLRVRVGMPATVTLPYLLDQRFEAKLAYVYPLLDPKTRTARVRLVLPNPELALRPGMYANVQIETGGEERLVVPQSALLAAGERSFVFLALGDGRFRPQRVTTGMRAGDDVEILSGIEPGQRIVTSATFLIASESRLRAALDQW